MRTLCRVETRYRKSPIFQEGTPRLRHGPQAGDRLPDAVLEKDGPPTSLHQELAGLRFHLLLCGPVQAWDTQQLATLRKQYGRLLTMHHLTREPAPGTLADMRGEAVTRLGVKGTAHYLVRPNGHVAYRGGGTNLEGLSRYLARMFPL